MMALMQCDGQDKHSTCFQMRWAASKLLMRCQTCTKMVPVLT